MPSDYNTLAAVHSVRQLKQIAAAHDAAMWIHHDPEDWREMWIAGKALDRWVLAEYGCRACGAPGCPAGARPRRLRAVRRACPPPVRGALLSGAPAPTLVEPAGGRDPRIPGSCVLAPTVSRMLAARGDNQVLDREIAYEEKAIVAGTLDPARHPVIPFAGAPAAAAVRRVPLHA
ncbi:hypothetical protein ACVGVM_29310 (plasmid) [Pseudonocardia bannensis]|uniref:hypothetical protein n=1 Tax=Pseudonocardia bannensis TaxID=630973 RepID=UPI001B7D0EE3|nr:hypothetical protein [Pseudonocardia bannensis]